MDGHCIKTNRSRRQLIGWASNQRLAYRRGTLSMSRIAALEALPNWHWKKQASNGEHIKSLVALHDAGEPRLKSNHPLYDSDISYRNPNSASYNEAYAQATPNWAIITTRGIPKLSYLELQAQIRALSITTQKAYNTARKVHSNWPSSPRWHCTGWVNWASFTGVANQHPPASRICKQCNRSFTIPEHLARRGKGIYCSENCYNKGKRTKIDVAKITQFCIDNRLTNKNKYNAFSDKPIEFPKSAQTWGTSAFFKTVRQAIKLLK